MPAQNSSPPRSESITKSDRVLRERDENERYVYEHRFGIVELHTSTLKCLSPEKYLNDAVVQFYLAVLFNESCLEEFARKIHVFDSIFYNRIKEAFPDKAPSIDADKYKQLNKWFTGIDLFEKHYLIFPVCQDDHWFAIIVCYPGYVEYFDDNTPSRDHNSNSRNKQYQPGIMVLDSLCLNRPLITREIRGLLDYEWRFKYKRGKNFSYHNLPQYHPNMPKQTNAYDCGIFMIAYLKTFFQQPDRFYRNIRKSNEQLPDSFKEQIDKCLCESSRESIKATISKLCEIVR